MNAPRKHNAVPVPWMAPVEWHYVRRNLFSGDKHAQREAYERVLCWQSRCGLKCPVAIVCTVNLIEATLTESTEMDHLNIAKLYSLAILRAIGLITDSVQLGGSAVPMHVLGSKLGIPQWIIDIRHEATHSVGAPSLSVAKQGVDYLLEWLRKEYWDALDPQVTSPRVKEYSAESSDFTAGDDITSLLLGYQQEQFQALMSGKKTSLKRHNIITRLRERLSTEDARNTLFSTLVQDGFLIPTEEQTNSLNISKAVTEIDDKIELNEDLQLFWRPVFDVVCEKKLLAMLMIALVKRLSKTSKNTEDSTNILTLGWINAICTAFPLADDNVLPTDSVLSKTICGQSLDTSWHPAFIACVTEVNKYTKAALNSLLSTIGKTLPASIRQGLTELFDIGHLSSQLNDGDDSIMAQTLDACELTSSLETMETMVTMDIVEEEDLSKLSGCSHEAWSIAPESVHWELYPLGKLPGQPDDPFLLNLLRTDCELPSESEARNERPIETDITTDQVQNVQPQRTVRILLETTDKSHLGIMSRNINGHEVTIL